MPQSGGATGEGGPPDRLHHSRFAVRAAGCIVAAVSLGALPAFGEDLQWDYAKQLGAVSVRDRPRDGLQPLGIRIGNYLLLPSLGFRTTWTKDSLDESIGRPRSIQHEVSTALEMQSNFARHMLDIRAEGRAVGDHRDAELRYIDGSVRVIGRLDITHATNLFGEMSTGVYHDDSVDEERPKAARKPTELALTRFEGGLSHRAGRIDMAIGARYARFDYKNAEANDGSVIEQNQRDFSLLEPFIRLGMRLSPGYRVFSEVAGRFQENRGDSLIDRDAEGIKATAGVEMEVSPLVKLTLRGGYFYQDYLQAGLVDISTPIYEARLDWYVSPLVTLGFNTTRDVQATTYGLASGRITTSYGVRADYEMWRNLIISGQVNYKLGDYIGEDRKDKIWSASLGADYILNRNWLISMGYEHQELVSSDSDLDRKVDKIFIGAKYRF